MKSLDPWRVILTDGSGDVVWPRPYYGHSFYQEVPSWIHYGDNGTRRLLFDGAFVGADAPSVGVGDPLQTLEVAMMMQPYVYAGYRIGANVPAPPIGPADTKSRRGLLAEVAPHVAPATGPISVTHVLDDRQVLHVKICVDGKCYQSSMDLASVITLLLEKLAQWHRAQHSATDQLPTTLAVAGAYDSAIGAAVDAMADILVCHHVNVMTGSFFDDLGSAIGGTLRELAPAISTVATAVATRYGGAEVGEAAGKLAPVVTNLQANLLDPKGDPQQKVAAQQSLQRVNQVAQSDPRAAQALAAAHQAVRDTAIAYHVKGTVDKAIAGDPSARHDVGAVVQAAERGDPAAKSTYEVIAQVLIDKAQHSVWGQQLWNKITGGAVSSGWYSTPVGGYFSSGEYPYSFPVGRCFDSGYDAYPSGVAIGGFWDSLGSGALKVYRTVSTPVTWFNKKVNQTIRDNPALKSLVVNVASGVATAWGGPAAGAAAKAFAPAIIDSSAETGGDPTMLFEGKKKEASQASGGDPRVEQAISHAHDAVTQTAAVATLTKMANDASRGDAASIRQINELKAHADAGDPVAIRAMSVVTEAQRQAQVAASRRQLSSFQHASPARG